MTDGDRRAWLELLPRLQAEKLLTEGTDLSGMSLDQLRQLHFAAYDDPKAAQAFMMQVYKDRLLAKEPE